MCIRDRNIAMWRTFAVISPIYSCSCSCESSLYIQLSGVIAAEPSLRSAQLSGISDQGFKTFHTICVHHTVIVSCSDSGIVKLFCVTDVLLLLLFLFLYISLQGLERHKCKGDREQVFRFRCTGGFSFSSSSSSSIYWTGLYWALASNLRIILWAVMGFIVVTRSYTILKNVKLFTRPGLPWWTTGWRGPSLWDCQGPSWSPPVKESKWGL